MFEIRGGTGRLIEIWLHSPVTVEAVAGFGALLAPRMKAIPRRVVICTHLADVGTFKPDVAAAFIELMRADNPKVERNGMLLAADASTFGMQLDRMVREAGNPARRVFRQRRELEAWLGEVLGEAERLRLARFLDVPSSSQKG